MIEDMILKTNGPSVKRILVGGQERYHSSYAAVNMLLMKMLI
jgi:2-C-methyl-D-erythritol 4-phosphate cytidylyltransferase